MLKTGHLLKFWDQLTEQERGRLEKQIQALPLQELESLPLQAHPLGEIEPIEFAESADAHLQSEGERLIRLGLVGALVMAGGQGTRLQFDGPKGLFPLSPIRNKCLFQLIAERVKAASKRAKRPLLMAIMVSAFDLDKIARFFEEERYFGLKREQIRLFPQGTMPLLTKDNELFLSTKSQVAEGSSGNGVLFYHFVESGAAAYFKEKGVHIVNIVLIDNPIADPFDPLLAAKCYSSGHEVIVKCIKRDAPHEQVGLLVNTKQGIRVVEYTELAPSARQDLRLSLANISLFSVTLPFIMKAAKRVHELPFHIHERETMGIPPSSDDPTPVRLLAKRHERFIFDNLAFADRIAPLVYRREETFAPLKRSTGEGSIASVQEALSRRDREVYQEISGLKAPDRPFELSLDFHYPTSVLKRLWKNRPLPEGDYITP